MRERRVPVEPVRRRPSLIDPAPTAWSVIGGGRRGRACLTALRGRRVPVVGYERRQADRSPDEDAFLRGHEVILINEIEDIDALAVTSQDAAGTIHTDYFFGVVLAVRATEPIVAHCVDEELIPGEAGVPASAGAMFTPRHPALVMLGLDGGKDAARRRRDIEMVAAYAVRLRDDPRGALGFHRAACAGVPG